jgi:hypothetical protein
MLRFGICTEDQYMCAGERRRFSGSRVSYSLLDVGDHPNEEQIRVFEDISFTLRLSNGTFRTTFRQRFRDVDAVAMRWMERLFSVDTELRVQDRAASHGLTSAEWAEQLFRVYPRADFEVSDTLFSLIRLSLDTGETYIVEPNGVPLQYIKPPFVVSLHYPESWRYPVNRFIASRAKRRFQQLVLPVDWMSSPGAAGYRVSKIPYVHPEARELSQKDARFRFQLRSVFEQTPAGCHVLRTMNIFNQAYFQRGQLIEGVEAAFASVKPGGLWIVGRTMESDFSHQVSFLRRREHGWEVVERMGGGSEIEDLALQVGADNSDGTAR